MRRCFTLHITASAAAKVGHGQVAQQRGLQRGVQSMRAQFDPAVAGVAQHVDAACQPGCTQGADDAPGQHAAAQGEAATQQVGLEAGQRAGDRTAQHRSAAFGQAFANGKLLGHAVEDLVLHAGRFGARARLQAVQRHQCGGAGAGFLLQQRSQLLLGAGFGALFVVATCDRAADLAQPLGQPLCFGDHFARGGAVRQAGRQQPHRFVERGFALGQPGCRQRRHQRGLIALQRVLDSLQQCVFVHPAACKSVQRQHARDQRPARQVFAPGLLVGGFFGGRPRRAQLVQQHQNRLANPGQHVHFSRDVGRRGRAFSGVDQVQHDAAVLLHMAQGLLAGPKRPLAPAVPHGAEEPAQWVVALLQAAQQPSAVAEAGRVGQQQALALCCGDQLVHRHKLGHVRCVAHLTDVAAKQRSRQRGLAGVGVRDQAQRDVDHVCS